MKADDDTLSFKAQQLQPPPSTITSMLKKTAATAAEAEKLSRVEASGLPVRAEAPRVEVTARPAKAPSTARPASKPRKQKPVAASFPPSVEESYSSSGRRRTAPQFLDASLLAAPAYQRRQEPEPPRAARAAAAAPAAIAAKPAAAEEGVPRTRRAGDEGLVALPDPAPAQPRVAAPVQRRVGDRVQARYQATALGPAKTSWFAGRVTACHADGSCDIAYEDGDSEKRVAPSFIKPPRRASSPAGAAPAEAAAASGPAEHAAKRPRRSTPSKGAGPQSADASSAQQSRPVVPDDLAQRRVRVWWAGDREWFAGKVVSYSRARGHALAYDDGTRETVRLGDRPGQMDDEWPWEFE